MAKKREIASYIALIALIIKAVTDIITANIDIIWPDKAKTIQTTEEK